MKKIAVLLAMAGGMMTVAHAQDQIAVSGRLDAVNNYVWRGIDQNSGASLQPALSAAYKGVSLTLWGSQSITRSDAQEFDVTLAYSYKGLTLSVADLWWGGLSQPYGYYQEGPSGNPLDGGHHLEASVSYHFGERFPLTLGWSTWCAGADARRGGGARSYTTYISAAYDINCPADITLTPSIGFTPWKGYYHDKTAVTDLSLKASKTLSLNHGLEMPLFVQGIVSPSRDHVYLVAGCGIGF